MVEHGRRIVLATFPGGCCLVMARLDAEVTAFIRKELGFMNGNIHLHDLTPEQIFDLELQGVKTYDVS